MSNISDHNAKVISSLSFRNFMAQFFFFGSIAMIPLGFLVPCGIALSLSEAGGAAAFLAIAAILLPFVGLGGLLLMGTDRRRYSRALALARIADDNNLRFTYQPKRKQRQVLGSFRLLADASQDFAANLMAGTLKKRPFLALDYNHAYDQGATATVHRKTVFVFTEGFSHLPEFVLSPRRDWMDTLAEVITGRPFKLTSSTKFSKQYALVASDQDAVEALFTGNLVRLCMDEEVLTMEARSGMLLVFPWETVVRENDYENFLDIVLDIAYLLRRRP